MTRFLPRRWRKLLSPLPELETERLLMRPVTLEDARDMFDYSRNPRTSEYLLWEPHQTIDFTVSHIRHLLSQYKAVSYFDWALVDKSSGRMIGTAGFTRLSGLYGTGELGYVLSPAYHRRGLAPEAVKTVMAFGFEKLELNSLFCRIMEGNIPSRKVAERLGFVFLGFEREPIQKRDARQRIARYQLTRDAYLQQNRTV
ncbi:MAG: GNAT family N-acetyltransferase [Clostridia bacterium]|nr:GNAT family N-acetyltransferase [Clostridia bacterium]